MTFSTYFNRVKYTPTLGGTGDFVTSAAVIGFRTPAGAAVSNGSIVSYVAFNATQTEWETGQGTYTSGTQTLARTTVRESSNGGAKVNFTAAPTVALDFQAQDVAELRVTELQVGTGVVLSQIGGKLVFSSGGVSAFEIWSTSEDANGPYAFAPRYFAAGYNAGTNCSFNAVNSGNTVSRVVGNKDDAGNLQIQGVLGWADPGSDALGTPPDVGIGRNNGGIAEINNGTLGSWAQLITSYLAATYSVVVGASFNAVDAGNSISRVVGNKGDLGGIQLSTGGILSWGPAGDPLGTAADTGISRNAAGLVEINNNSAGTFRDLKLRDIYVNNTSFMVRGTGTWTNGSGASTGTLTNAPAAGNPTKWISVDDNGTTRKIPAW